MEYQPVIGLEIHAELKTDSKMFCDCPNEPEPKEPNVNICPVCSGQPGSLPVINQKAVEAVIKAALALNCQIPQFSKFDRKNYFYPDLPKGYQISQYDKPLSEKGYIEINNKKIRITRIHLEEDTGKLTHPEGVDYSLVDYNRAGVPLMELVTEPDIESGAEARQFGQTLQMIFRQLDISNADMEKGQMRVEVNISLKKNNKMGTKVEIKNLNSFRAVEKSIDYEIERQTDVLDAGDKVAQETRGWNENIQKTFSQRTKEEAHDYRYFPEPDLPPLAISAAQVNQLKKELPELPQKKKERFKEQYKVSDLAVDFLTSQVANGKMFLAVFFENAVSELDNWLKHRKKDIDEKKRQKLIKLMSNYIMTEFPKYVQANGKGLEKITAENYAEFVDLIDKGDISSSAAQMVLAEMFKAGGDPSHIIEDKGLKQVSDKDSLQKIVDDIIKENSGPVKDFQAGKEQALQYLVGQVMKETKGQANPKIVGEILREKLKK